jgi:hypothetical protein
MVLQAALKLVEEHTSPSGWTLCSPALKCEMCTGTVPCCVDHSLNDYSCHKTYFAEISRMISVICLDKVNRR